MTDAPQTRTQPPGDVQAFDVRTGKPRWTFHVIPQPGEVGNETWERRLVGVLGPGESLVAHQRRRGTGAGVLSADQRDQRHVRRPSARATTCSPTRWSRQVRHRRTRLALSDRAPRSVGLRSAGRADPRRHHRRRPRESRRSCRSPSRRSPSSSIAPTDSRCGRSRNGRCPRSDTPGERTSPTQPFPTKPPPFDRQGVTVDDLIDFTPELRAEALQLVKQYRIGPLFTPPSIRGDGPGAHEGHGSTARFGRRRRLAGRRVRSRHAACCTCRRLRARSWPTSSRAIRREPISTTCPAGAPIRPARRGCRCSSRRTAGSRRST